MTLSEAYEEAAPVSVESMADSADATATIQLEQAGEWMAADELRLALLQAQEREGAAVLHFGGLTHLETSSLQVLLAAAKGMRLSFESVTDGLRQCFHASGAAGLLQAEQGAA